MATYSYLHPMSHTARWYSGNTPDVGAYEFMVSPYRSAPDEKVFSVRIFPNPAAAGTSVYVNFNAPLMQESVLSCIDQQGKTCARFLLEKSRLQTELVLPNLTPGIYWLHIPGMGVVEKVVLN
jgi:hypothetical protein